MQHLRWPLTMNSADFTQKNVELAVTVYSGMATRYRYQLLANSVDEATMKSTSPDFENMDIARSDDETLIIDPNILDVVANLPPKNQWTEHLVEYPVIAFIDAANVNRFLNSTVM